jgi:hypothetical protein
MDVIQGSRNRKQGIGARKCSTWNIFILLSLVSSLLLNYQQGFEKISEVSAQMSDVRCQLSVVSSQFSVLSSRLPAVGPATSSARLSGGFRQSGKAGSGLPGKCFRLTDFQEVIQGRTCSEQKILPRHRFKNNIFNNLHTW